jgi:hypothetical protein
MSVVHQNYVHEGMKINPGNTQYYSLHIILWPPTHNLKMERAGFSITVVPTYKTPTRHIPEDNLHSHSSDNSQNLHYYYYYYYYYYLLTELIIITVTISSTIILIRIIIIIIL